MNSQATRHEDSGEPPAVLRHVCVLDEMGLHARPAARLAQEAQKFSADIRLVSGKQEVDAKSILDILTLAVGNGAKVAIKAVGEDAEEAIEHLERLFRNKFQED
ncbi:Phosphotransferase system, phosphocarrier protein HPr [Desulfovibrio sp. X2]|uniref:HPr family phosphocarrier protein n=1 Tax=Desulfovibrio sp. X2 TaxID=941449 RepID=UPI0003588CCE|nr:HPr family phosphocarrier protein [Desulfovibrio sp. X2]EPR41683.1 Phosphotransferase system, phosphocarrier protein HPr [Desulfovibrio sp. X2]